MEEVRESQRSLCVCRKPWRFKGITAMQLRSRNYFLEVEDQAEGQLHFLTLSTLGAVEEHRDRKGQWQRLLGLGLVLLHPLLSPTPHRHALTYGCPYSCPFSSPHTSRPEAHSPCLLSSFWHSALPSRSGQDTPVGSWPETPQPSRHPVAPYRW